MSSGPDDRTFKSTTQNLLLVDPMQSKLAAKWMQTGGNKNHEGGLGSISAARGSQRPKRVQDTLRNPAPQDPVGTRIRIFFDFIGHFFLQFLVIVVLEASVSNLIWNWEGFYADSGLNI